MRAAAAAQPAPPPATTLAAAAQARLASLTAQARRRTLIATPVQPVADEHSRLIDLRRNDYLALATDSDFQSACRAALAAWPIGGGSSRLLGGEHACFADLETAFAAFKGAEASLFFPSGFAANEAVMTTLARLEGVAFFSDALNHASIIDGLKLARLPASQRTIVPHNDLAALSAALAASPLPHKIVVTEAVFSMDGDLAPLADLGPLLRRHAATLVLDEAHSILCLGRGGRGLAEASGLPPEQLITINTCGKAMGVQGALVAGPTWLRELMINTARSFIYTTAPSPWLAAALQVSLAWAERLAERRERLHRLSTQLRDGLQALDYDTLASASHIVPVVCGRDERALALSAALAQRGILAPAIRPPTVAEGTARLRLSVHAGLTQAAIGQVLAAFFELRDVVEHGMTTAHRAE